MENRLKERLTGAAILVALIVLLVPEMFHGQRSETAAPASSGDGPPMRSYTIDLSNSPASTAPLQSTSPGAGADGSVEPAAATAPAAAPAATPASAPATVAPQVSSAPAPAPSRPSASSPSPVPAVAASKPSAATTKPPAASATVASAAHAANGSWSVQLGLFAQHDNAERMMHSAQARGFSANVSDKDAKGLYHVQVVNLTDRAAALAMQGRLRDQGFAAAVVPPH